MFERLLRFHALLAPHAAVDYDHSILAPQQGCYTGFEIAQRIAVFGENNELLARRRNRRRDAGRLGWRLPWTGIR